MPTDFIRLNAYIGAVAIINIVVVVVGLVSGLVLLALWPIAVALSYFVAIGHPLYRRLLRKRDRRYGYILHRAQRHHR